MDKNNDYAEMLRRHQQEINDFPMVFAFSDRQLEEALKKLSATIDEVTTLPGNCAIFRKRDVPAWYDLCKRQSNELKEAMKHTGFAEEAFLYEMNNHEYAINWEGDSDVLACFGYSSMDELKEAGLLPAYRRARHCHMDYMTKLGVI